MVDQPAPPKPAKTTKAEPKAARLAMALRANLARRKAQKRARLPDPADTEKQGH